MKLLAYKLFHIALRRSSGYFFILIILSFFLAQAGHTACTGSEVVVTIPNLNFNLNNIPLQGKIGSEIITPQQAIAKCQATGSENPSLIFRDIYDPGNSSTLIMGKNIYPTSVAGIGYAVGLEAINFCSGAGVYWVPFSTCQVPVSGTTLATFNAKLHFQLYRIGVISNATNITIFRNNFLIREFTGWTTSAVAGQYYIYQSSLPFNVQIYTCSVQSSSIINVNFPTVSVKAIPSDLSSKIPFSLTVNCPNTTNLNITFTDNNNIGQTTNILTPTATSTAKGVGVQLQYNGKIISFGPDSAEPGTINQIVLNNNLTGIQTFPFTASYVRTGTVTPGTISARATFTLSYQ